MRTAIRNWWMHFWFEPVGPSNLGLCRILLFGALFLFYLPQDFSAWAEFSDSFFMPVWLFEILHLPVLSHNQLYVLESVWKVSLALSCIGLFTRVSTSSCFILGTYLLGLPHSLGKVHHFDALLVFVLLIMALSRCGDGFSIDQLIRKARQGSNRSVQRPQASGEYTWPVRAVWLTISLVFFAAGVAKLRHSGLEWIFSDNMALTLIAPHYEWDTSNYTEPLVSWGLYFAQYLRLTQAMALLTLVFEIAYPLALFSVRARWIIVPGMIAMHLMVRLLMGPAFYQFMICDIFWVPWDHVRLRLISRLRGDSLRNLPTPNKRNTVQR